MPTSVRVYRAHNINASELEEYTWLINTYHFFGSSLFMQHVCYSITSSTLSMSSNFIFQIRTQLTCCSVLCGPSQVGAREMVHWSQLWTALGKGEPASPIVENSTPSAEVRTVGWLLSAYCRTGALGNGIGSHNLKFNASYFTPKSNTPCDCWALVAVSRCLGTRSNSAPLVTAPLLSGTHVQSKCVIRRQSMCDSNGTLVGNKVIDIGDRALTAR